MRIILVGPGRAGMSISLAATRSGHAMSGVLGRSSQAAKLAADRLSTAVLDWGEQLPSADLLVAAVRDDAITEVAARLVPIIGEVRAAVHLSGLAGLESLAPLAQAGLPVGSLHPLQTMPDPDTGSALLDGSWAAIDASDDALRLALGELAASLGMQTFDLQPRARGLYHAAAAAAANFPLAALAMAEDLFAQAGVPFAAAGPLTSAVVANAFEQGPRTALTGPVARGDVGTVQAQLAAVEASAPDWLEHYRSMVAAVAKAADREKDFARLLRR